MSGVKKFWAVWRENGGGPPNKKHATKDEAVREAARLAQQTNDRYLVLEVIGAVASLQVPVDWVDAV